MIQNKLTIEEMCRKLKPIFGEKIDQVYFKYSTANTIEEKNEIIQLLVALYQKNLNKLLDSGILLQPPKKENVEGEYPLADVNYSGKNLYNFSLREKDWPRHVCVTGMSGSGKTTFAFNILNNFIEKNKPFLVFDWKKSFRPLMAKDKSLMCFTVGNDKVSNSFKVNINIPPKGVSPKEWINTLCDLLTESFCVSFGVHKILLETLDEVFDGWGVYEGGEHYPNWMHIKKMLEDKANQAKGRETGWYESALRVATVLTFGDFGKVVNYEGRKSFSVEELFNKRAILELNSLSNIEKKFFSEYILTYIYKLKKANQNKIEEGFNYAILVDEAHNIFLKNRTHFVSESVTDMVYREMREYGTSLICLDQHISKLSDTVTGNSACHIAFQQQLPEDIQDISSLMQLQDRKEIFSQLQVGSAIVKLSERYTAPFLIDVPFQDLRKNNIDDEKIKSRMQCLIQGREVEKFEPEFKEKICETAPKKEVKVKQNSHDLSEEIIIIEPKELTEKQKILYEFGKEQINSGFSLEQIEEVLLKGLIKNRYEKEDMLAVLNYLKDQAKPVDDIPKPQEIIVKQPEISLDGLSLEEKRFLKYLIKNPEHESTTVEFYKSAGFSARKGNVIKKQLLEKNKIKIEEEKYEKGWRKFIRLQTNIH